MEGFQALVTIVPWNVVAQIANLLITMLLVKKFLSQRVQKKRQSRPRPSTKRLWPRPRPRPVRS